MSDRQAPKSLINLFYPADRDYAIHVVINDANYDLQLLAVRSLLQRQKESDNSIESELKRVGELADKATSVYNPADDEWQDLFMTAVYQDAAHSMAAVGMLAPMIESLFLHTFASVRRILQRKAVPTEHVRWLRAGDEQWDCHIFWSRSGRQEDLVRGIMQLAEATGLNNYLPANLQITLDAIFSYRNKMFHCGFEWPLDERQKFKDRIERGGWPKDWFHFAEHNNDPWIFYMGEEFIQHCLSTIDTVLDGVGRFAKAQDT